MLISNSTDITTLKLPVTFDLSSAVPSVKISNSNVGAHLNLVKLAFELYDPNGHPLHIGNLTSPDALGNFAGPFTFTEDLPNFDNSILWASSNPYKLIVRGIDSHDVPLYLEQNVYIVPPAGNQNVGKNYAEANLLITVDCNRAQAKIIDQTSYSYRGLTGTVVSKTLTIITPTDPTGTTPDPTVYNGLSVVLHPLLFAAKGYQAVISSKIKYDLSNGTGDAFVVINYVKYQQFDVNCNYDLCPLLSEFGKLIEKANTNCDSDSENLIKIISPKILNLILARQQATCGYDIGAMIDDIKKTAGWNCNCDCDRTIGLNGIGTSDGSLNVQFDTAGDITATADVNGSNVLIHIKDFTYIFKMCDVPGSAAFTVTPGINGRTKTFCLSVDKDILANEIITSIKNNPTLLQYFNTIINVNGLNLKLTVDGRCIIQTRSSCTYTFTKTLAVGTDYKLFNLNVDQIPRYFDIPFTTTSPASVLNAGTIGSILSALGMGDFVATYNSDSRVLTIVSEDNTRLLNDLIFYDVIGGGMTNRFVMDMQKQCGDIVPLPADDIVNAMLYYMCKLSTVDIKLGGNIVVCSIDSDGYRSNTSYQGTLYEYLAAQATAFCNAIDAILTKKNISCADVKNMFISTKAIAPDDVVYGGRSGECGPWSIRDLFTTIISFVTTTNDQTIKTQWCNAVNLCNSSSSLCAPVPAGSANYDGTHLNISWANNGAGNYKVGYRIWGTNDAFTEATLAASGGAGTTGSVQYTVPKNRYEVRIIAVCASSQAVPFYTSTQICPDMTAFNVSKVGSQFQINYSVPDGATKVNLVIVYPNGGGSNEILDVVDPGIIMKDIPAGVYGTYTFKIRNVCDEANGWYGAFTNVIEFLIQQPHVINTIYYGFLDSYADPLTKDEIESSFAGTTPGTGGDVVIDFTSVGDPQFIWFAERLTEPVKTAWEDTVNAFNHGSIGSPTDLFAAPVEVETTYRFYVSNYKTVAPNPLKLEV